MTRSWCKLFFVSTSDPKLNVEELSDDSSTQSRRKVIVANHDIATIHIDGDGDDALVEYVPLDYIPVRDDETVEKMPG